MPSWKKVITSGSSAALQSLTVTGGITGSLFGTSSWANNATTATSATTATNANNVAVTDTTTGTGPYYVMFADGTTGNRAVRVDSATLTFNATTNTLTVANLAGTASYVTASNVFGPFGSNSILSSSFAVSSSRTITSSFATTASFVTTAQTASFVTTAQTASYVTASNVFGPFGSNSILSSSFAVSSSRAVSSSFASTASFVTTAQTASYALTASNVQGGTANYIPIWNTATSLSSSTIYQSTGNVGIGTTSPSFPLSFGATTGNKIGLYDAGSGTGYGFGIQGQLLQIFANTSGDDISFGYGNSTAFTRNVTFKGTGNVGIGTTSPYSRFTTLGALSTTTSQMSIVNSEGGHTILRTGIASISNSGFSLISADVDGTNQNTRLVVSSAGNVGIGTTTPSERLHVSGSTIITGTAAIGTGSLGASENTITLGARDASSEGGQIGFNAPGGTYTSASFIDNWQNKARILKGNNATSTGLIAQWDIHTTQLQLPAYVNATSFIGTATANLAVDSGGNVITVSTSGGSVFPYTGTAGVTGSISATGPIYSQVNGGMYFQGGDDAALYDINISNHMGIYGVQDSTVGAIKLGSNGPVLYGSGSSLGIGTTTPNSGALHVNGGVFATSFTGSLFGTSSWATNAITASFVTTAQTASFITASNVFGPFGSNSIISASNATTASFVTTAQTASYVLQAVSSSFATNASTASYVLQAVSSSFASTASFVTTAQTASFVTASNVFGPFGSNSVISASHATTASYALTSSFSLAASANTILVINKSGATISKGMVVHLTGSNNSSDTPYVITASYQSDQLSANTLGVASQTIAFNDTGYITTEGVLTGIDVTGLTSGQLIYLGNAGSITGSAPVAPLHSVRIGQVVRDSPSNNGAIYVRVDNGYELGELHDIIDSTTTSSYGDLLVKSGSVWNSSRQLTGSYGLTGSLNVTGTLQVDAALVDYASVNPTVSGLNTIYTQATGSFTSAFMKYTVSSGSNTRAGEFMTAWNGTNIVYTDTSTTDIGNTSGISFLSAIVSSQLRVSASCTTAGWNVKTLSTFI